MGFCPAREPGKATGRGTVRGLGPSGELLVLTEDGAGLKLYAEDVKVRQPL